jgi:hypothetical protein
MITTPVQYIRTFDPRQITFHTTQMSGHNAWVIRVSSEIHIFSLLQLLAKHLQDIRKPFHRI